MTKTPFAESQSPQTLEKSGRKDKKWNGKDKNRRINIKLPAVWEPKCCVQHVTREEQFRTACEITEDQVSHCRHLFSYYRAQCDPDCLRKQNQRVASMAGAGAGPGKWTTTWVGTMGELNPLLLFKLYRKLPSKTQTNCRKYNCNSTFHARGYLGGMGNSSGMWQCGWQMRKTERERDCVPYHYSLENSTRPNRLSYHIWIESHAKCSVETHKKYLSMSRTLFAN